MTNFITNLFRSEGSVNALVSFVSDNFAMSKMYEMVMTPPQKRSSLVNDAMRLLDSRILAAIKGFAEGVSESWAGKAASLLVEKATDAADFASAFQFMLEDLQRWPEKLLAHLDDASARRLLEALNKRFGLQTVPINSATLVTTTEVPPGVVASQTTQRSPAHRTAVLMFGDPRRL